MVKVFACFPRFIVFAPCSPESPVHMGFINTDYWRHHRNISYNRVYRTSIYHRYIWMQSEEGGLVERGDFRKLQAHGRVNDDRLLPKTWVKGNRLDKGGVVSIEGWLPATFEFHPCRARMPKHA